MHAPTSFKLGDFTGGTIPIRDVVLRNISIHGPDVKQHGVAITCVNVSGTSSDVTPPGALCKELQGTHRPSIKSDDEDAPTTPLLKTSTIVVNSDGSYSVPVDGTEWLQSVAPRLRLNSTWEPLLLQSHTPPQDGTDTLGNFERVQFAWTAGTSMQLTTSIRVYESGVVVFGQNFTTKLTTDGRAGKDSPLSWWPAFDHSKSAPKLGYLGFTGCMSGGAHVGRFEPATAGAEEQEEDKGVSNLSLKPCKAGLASQAWKFVSDGGADAAACAKGAAKCMVENEGSRLCLQISHCSIADGASISANVQCDGNSMCKGNNLGWHYDAKKNNLVSTLSKKCLTAKGDTVTQEACKGSSDQTFYFDEKTGHLGQSSSPIPTPTICLEGSGMPNPGHRPSGPPQLSSWGGYQSGPLAIFDNSARTLLLSPLTEHMSSVMNAGSKNISGAVASVAVGVGGAVTTVPAGHSMQAILYSGGHGIRDSYEYWGDAMMQYHGKTRTALDHDVFISHMGCEFSDAAVVDVVSADISLFLADSTTAYYFYNQCDCGYHWPRVCSATDHSGPKSGSDNTPPKNLQGCRTYEDTLIDVHRSHQRAGLPVKYFLVDSCKCAIFSGNHDT